MADVRGTMITLRSNSTEGLTPSLTRLREAMVGTDCIGPVGAELDCRARATMHLVFSIPVASGGWFVCDTCAVRIAMWLEDKWGAAFTLKQESL